MATATFYKNIVIDDAAVDAMIALLNKPVPPRPDISGKFRMLTEEDWELCLQRRAEKLAAQSNTEQ